MQTEIRNKMAYLVDTNGKVVHSGDLSIQEEQTLKEMLDVIMQRGEVARPVVSRNFVPLS